MTHSVKIQIEVRCEGHPNRTGQPGFLISPISPTSYITLPSHLFLSSTPMSTTTYHLRPVSSSPSPAAEHSPHYKQPRQSPPPVARRRPMSPSSLRGNNHPFLFFFTHLISFQNLILAIHPICLNANTLLLQQVTT